MTVGIAAIITKRPGAVFSVDCVKNFISDFIFKMDEFYFCNHLKSPCRDFGNAQSEFRLLLVPVSSDITVRAFASSGQVHTWRPASSFAPCSGRVDFYLSGNTSVWVMSKTLPMIKPIRSVVIGLVFWFIGSPVAFLGGTR